MNSQGSQPTATWNADKLAVRVFANRDDCGAAAGRHVSALLRGLLRIKPTVSIVFGAAPSQNEFFAALGEEAAIDWSRVVAFQMDEYIGVPEIDPRVLRHFFEKRLYGKVRPGQTPFLKPDAKYPRAECRRYAKVLKEYPLDISCLGIGESCHLAYNDPHVAKFDDSEAVKVVEIDEMSQMQQVHDGTVKCKEDAIIEAYTLTIPTLLRAQHVSCVAPGKVKAAAVARTLKDPIQEKTPSTILRTHASAVLFLDKDSASKI